MSALSLLSAAAEPDNAPRVALVSAGVAHTFADLSARASKVRAALAREGVGKGARVALRAHNDPDTVAVVHALIDLQATLVPVHPRLTEEEAATLVADAAPHVVLQPGDLSRLFVDGVDDGTKGPLPSLGKEDPSSPLAIIYTSGTAGRPKGAVLSRGAFLASAAASAENLGWADDDRWLLCMPVCHVGGLSILTRCLIARRAVLLEPRFDADAILATIVRERATLLSVVPTMLRALLECDPGGVLARLRAVLVGGAGASMALLEACERGGVQALATYGLTEACSQVTVQRLRLPYRATLGSGPPLRGLEVRIRQTDGVGHIHVRGPTLMDGYFAGADRAPVDSRDADGWFDTGDLGALDGEGHLHVNARRSDLIVTGGENVYPVEVEQRLEALPGVCRALVFGVPDERWGQVVAAALELTPGATLGAVAGLLPGALAAHKRPRLACAVDALPTTTSGKLVRAGAATRFATALRPLRSLGPRVLP